MAKKQLFKSSAGKLYQLLALFILFAFASNNAFAQASILNGTIIDETGQGAIGAYVLNKTNNKGTSTDLDGNFSLAASIGDVLSITHIGYKTLEMSVSSLQNVQITLEPDTQLLDEVVVVGYGTQKRKNIIGSLESVDVSDIQKNKKTNVMTAMQGAVAGVNIQSASGAPGSTPNVTIRGVGTMGDHSPLYVIDGSYGDMTFLDPDDIESLTVLKDAAAAAIYGSRAANGVILITTKRGKSGTPKVEFGVDYTFKYSENKYKMLNAQQYAEFAKYLYEDAGNVAPDWILNYNQYGDTNWMDEMTRVAPTQKYRIAVNGGSENVTYDVAASYLGDKGTMIENYENRPSIRARVDFKRGKVASGLQLSYAQKTGRGLSYSGESVLTDILAITPLGKPYTDDNDYMLYLGDNKELKAAHYANPVFSAKHADAKYENDYTNINGYVSYEIIKDLVAKAQGSFDNYSDWSYWYSPAYNYGASDVQAENKISESRASSKYWNVNATLSYAKEIKKHSFDAMVGWEARKSTYRYIGGSGEGFASSEIRVPSGASKNEDIYGTASATSYVSLFARANYNFDNRYYLSATVRRDASSKFAQNNRWGNFPSVAVAWRISNEKFFAPVKHWFNDLKLRASYGQLGNDRIGNYQFQSLLSNDRLYYLYGGSSVAVNGWTVKGLANKDIKWETSTSRNIGVDMGFFDSKLTVFVEYFNNITSDLLVNKYIPLSNGVNTGITSNYGKISNKGVEVSATYKNYEHKLKWDVTGNVSFLKNKVIRMGSHGDYIEDGQINYTAYFTRTQEGQPVGSFYVYEDAGLFQSVDEINAYVNKDGQMLQPNALPGDMKFVDRNNDGVIDEDDKFFVGNPFPKAEFGLVFNATLKDFDFMVNLGGAVGFYLVNGLKYKFESSINPLFNKSVTVLDRWTPTNTNTSVPRIGANDDNNNRRPSTRYIEKGDYLRVRNIQIGYTIPKTLLKNIKWRFYVSLSNMFTITGYNGNNPEVGGSSSGFNRGVDVGNYPLYKTVSFGTSFLF